MMPDHRALLRQTAELAADYLAGIERRHVGTRATRADAMAAATIEADVDLSVAAFEGAPASEL
jgi:hypothetical protein